MRVTSIVLIVLGVALILFGVADHYLTFTHIPFELYIFSIVGFVMGVVGGVLATLKGGVVPPDPDPNPPIIIGAELERPTTVDR